MNVSKKDKNSSSILRKRLRNFVAAVLGLGLTSIELFSTLPPERIRLEQNSQAL